MNEPRPETCPVCHKFRSCICPPPSDAPEADKRAHEHFLKAAAEIDKIVGLK